MSRKNFTLFTLKMFRAFLLFLVAYAVVMTATPFVALYKILTSYKRKDKLTDILFTMAIGFDQAGGSVLYEQENFTVSSYTYYLCTKQHRLCWFMKFIDLIFGKDHCKKSYEWEVKNDLDDINSVLDKILEEGEVSRDLHRY